MTSFISGLSLNSAAIMTVISIIFYFVECLFGYKIIKISCALAGFIIGCFAGAYISGSVLALASPWPVIIAVAAGIVLACISFWLYLAGVFVLGLFFAFTLALKIPYPSAIAEGIWPIVISLIIGIIVGILAVKFQRIIIIFLTGAGGAYGCINGIASITTFFASGASSMKLMVTLLLAAIGIVLQLIMTRKG
ncbi:MAG: DUF4203 domain-containing protein [Lachnospiraceae bacterium]|nr:DUF4203 domain-containing protein [Lachnospiraceae bacterium]